MNKLQIFSVLAGICFGIWPLFMNRSGLTGNVSSAAFCLVALIGVLPFAIKSGSNSLATASWLMVVLAGLFGALGLLFFNGMLAKASMKTVGSLFVLMTVVQIAIPAIYQVIITGRLPLGKLTGFIAAVIAALLLL